MLDLLIYQIRCTGKSVKKGFEFTLMVVGESGLGKSTLVDSLFDTDIYPERIVPSAGGESATCI